ncbi:hypothetical protein [Nocardia suismassiliense]|uniref:hypothetical protein n=1 Tax=Nocardia suismassiliense TaxID=2077092 RepID=UPI001F3316DC|nr:hypothetical protein [Nocardia suismassiliense]
MSKLVTWTEVALARPGWVRLELELAARSDPDHRSGKRSAQRSAQLCNAIAALLDTVRSEMTTDTLTEVRAAMVWSTIVGFVCRNAHNREVSRAAIEQHITYVVRFALT